MRDRAWPFPDRDVDTTVCERTLGFTTFGGQLKEKVLSAAEITGPASILNAILLVV